MPYKITDSDVLEFNEAGITILRGVLSPQQIETLKRGIDKGYANPSPKHKIASEDTDTGRFFEDFRCWKEIPEYQEIIFRSELPRIAAKLCRSRTIRLHHDHMLIKKPKTQQHTPWHQDTPYYNMEGEQTVSFWIPVDPVPLDSAMEFVVGSHKWSWLMPRTFKDNEAKWFKPGTLPEMPDIERNRSLFPIVSWEMQPGDVLAFNFTTLHGARGSTSERRALSIRYIGDDVIYVPRPWVTSPPFPELDADPTALKPRGPFNHELFPIVYSAEGKL